VEIKGDEVLFSTGKIKDANCGFIGINPSLEVSEGYDGTFYSDNESRWLNDEDKLTKAELTELADYMIDLWKKFKSLHIGK